MPVFVVDHNGAFPMNNVYILADERVGLLCDFFIKLFPVFVILIDVFPLFIGIVQVAAYEEVNGFYSALHSSGCVYPGPDLENHVADCDVFVCEFAKSYDAPEPEIRV